MRIISFFNEDLAVIPILFHHLYFNDECQVLITMERIFTYMKVIQKYIVRSIFLKLGKIIFLNNRKTIARKPYQ